MQLISQTSLNTGISLLFVKIWDLPKPPELKNASFRFNGGETTVLFLLIMLFFDIELETNEFLLSS